MPSRLIEKVGCFADSGTVPPPVHLRGRVARAVGGLAFLAAALCLGFLELVPLSQPALWVAAAVLAWFGVSHLVASVTAYRGCPEIGAIAAIVLDRPVATNCDIWQWLDRMIGAAPRLSRGAAAVDGAARGKPRHRAR